MESVFIIRERYSAEWYMKVASVAESYQKTRTDIAYIVTINEKNISKYVTSKCRDWPTSQNEV